MLRAVAVRWAAAVPGADFARGVAVAWHRRRVDSHRHPRAAVHRVYPPVVGRLSSIASRRPRCTLPNSRPLGGDPSQQPAHKRSRLNRTNRPSSLPFRRGVRRRRVGVPPLCVAWSGPSPLRLHPMRAWRACGASPESAATAVRPCMPAPVCAGCIVACTKRLPSRPCRHAERAFPPAWGRVVRDRRVLHASSGGGRGHLVWDTFAAPTTLFTAVWSLRVWARGVTRRVLA